MNLRVEKNRIIDILIPDGDFHLLKHRIFNVYNFVHKIIIVLTSDEKINQKIKFDSSTWSDKIIFIDKEFSESFRENYDLKLIIPILNNFDVNFEDLVCFSTLSELPDYSNFELVVEHLKFEPVILRMVDFVYNLKIHCNTKHLGTYCLNFGQILNNNEILKKLTVTKKRIISSTMHVVDNGNNFNFFPEDDFFNLETMSDNIHPESSNENKKKYLTDYEGTYNFDTSFLAQKNLSEDIKLKTLVIINHHQNKVDDSLLEEYDRVFNFNYTRDFTFPEKLISGQIFTFNIFLPKNPLYETEGDFFLSYFYSQVVKKLHGLNLMNNQNLDFVAYYDRLKIENKKTFKWSQIRSEMKEIIN